MKVLFITQVYAPDTVSVSQHVSDLADHLSLSGCSVDVITSRYQYEDPTITFAAAETIGNVSVKRIKHTHFQKSNPVLRAINMLTFNMSLAINLLLYSKDIDVIIGTTVPPFSALIGIWIAKIKKVRFHYWIMDLQPELSISSGMIKEKSVVAWLFTQVGNFIIRNSDKIFSLDTFMSDYLVNRGASADKIVTSPVWPVALNYYGGDRLSNPFRVSNAFGEKVVIMYSGNHAYVHPLDTLLETANLLKDRQEFLFAFVGGGVRKKDVANYSRDQGLDNIVQLPFQPRDQMHISLGASDIQVVVMGENLVGFTHPNKVYGAIHLAKPVLYIGPSPSHVSEILDCLEGNIQANHGESEKIASELIAFYDLSQSERDGIGHKNRQYCGTAFDPTALMDVLVDAIVADIREYRVGAGITD